MKKIILKNVLSWLALLSVSSSVFALQANTDLILSKISQDWKNIVISVDIDNPSNQNISSVQSWIEFDKSKLNCKSINTDESAFDFVVPWESNVSWNIVKIWRSSLSWDVAEAKINVAKINCEILNPKIWWWEVKFYDYQTDWWKVSVMVFDNWFPVNTLKWEPKSLKLDWEKQSEVKKVVQDNISLKYENENLDRPTDLRLDTQIWSVTLAWKKIMWASKYYIYYWKISWRYLQRRLISNVDIYKLEWLETWSQYFFAITAVWENWIESDYSDEQAIIVWKPQTATSSLIKKNKNKTYWENNNHVQENISTKKNFWNQNVYINKQIQNKKITKNVQSWSAETALIALFLAFLIWGFIYRKKINLIKN